MQEGTPNVSTKSLACVQTLSPPLTKWGDSFSFASDAPAWQCCFSRDGSLLAVCYGAPDICIRIWQGPEEWSLLATLSGVHTRSIRSIAFCPVGRILASASFDGTVGIWECTHDSRDANEDINGPLRNWECTAQLEGHENEVKCVTWNDTGTLLGTCGRDKSVWIWECFLSASLMPRDPETADQGEFDCIAVLHGHEGDVKSICFAPSHDQWGDGDEILLSASYDDTIKCWAEDAGEWYCAATLSAHASTVWSIATTPGGVRLVSGSDDQSIAVWKCYTAREKAKLFPNDQGASAKNGCWKCVGQLPDAHASVVFSVACPTARAGHGRIASGGGDNCIQIYREVGGTSDKPIFTLDAVVNSAHEGDVHCVTWHPLRGRILASAGGDGLVKIWRYNG